MTGSVHVVVGADDLPRDIGPELGYAGNELLDADALPERVFAFQKFVDEILVDQGDLDGGCGVLIVKARPESS